MPTNLDTLIIDLQLDASKFNNALDRSTSKALRQGEEIVQKYKKTEINVGLNKQEYNRSKRMVDSLIKDIERQNKALSLGKQASPLTATARGISDEQNTRVNRIKSGKNSAEQNNRDLKFLQDTLSEGKQQNLLLSELREIAKKQTSDLSKVEKNTGKKQGALMPLLISQIMSPVTDSISKGIGKQLNPLLKSVGDIEGLTSSITGFAVRQVAKGTSKVADPILSRMAGSETLGDFFQQSGEELLSGVRRYVENNFSGAERRDYLKSLDEFDKSLESSAKDMAKFFKSLDKTLKVEFGADYLAIKEKAAGMNEAAPGVLNDYLGNISNTANRLGKSSGGRESLSQEQLQQQIQQVKAQINAEKTLLENRKAINEANKQQLDNYKKELDKINESLKSLSNFTPKIKKVQKLNEEINKEETAQGTYDTSTAKGQLDYNKSVDKVAKLETELQPLITDELKVAMGQIQSLQEKYNEISGIVSDLEITTVSDNEVKELKAKIRAFQTLEDTGDMRISGVENKDYDDKAKEVNDRVAEIQAALGSAIEAEEGLTNLNTDLLSVIGDLQALTLDLDLQDLVKSSFNMDLKTEYDEKDFEEIFDGIQEYVDSIIMGISQREYDMEPEEQQKVKEALVRQLNQREDVGREFDQKNNLITSTVRSLNTELKKLQESFVAVADNASLPILEQFAKSAGKDIADIPSLIVGQNENPAFDKLANTLTVNRDTFDKLGTVEGFNSLSEPIKKAIIKAVTDSFSNATASEELLAQIQGAREQDIISQIDPQSLVSLSGTMIKASQPMYAQLITSLQSIADKSGVSLAEITNAIGDFSGLEEVQQQSKAVAQTVFSATKGNTEEDTLSTTRSFLSGEAQKNIVNSFSDSIREYLARAQKFVTTGETGVASEEDLNSGELVDAFSKLAEATNLVTDNFSNLNLAIELPNSLTEIISNLEGVNTSDLSLDEKQVTITKELNSIKQEFKDAEKQAESLINLGQLAEAKEVIDQINTKFVDTKLELDKFKENVEPKELADKIAPLIRGVKTSLSSTEKRIAKLTEKLTANIQQQQAQAPIQAVETVAPVVTAVEAPDATIEEPEVVVEADMSAVDDELARIMAEMEAAEGTVDVEVNTSEFDSSLDDFDWDSYAADTGSEISAGLVDGIESGQDDVNSIISDTSKSVIDTARDVLDINSPSREFEEIGYWTVQGFIRGIEDNGLVSTVSEYFGEAISAAQARISGEELNTDLQGLNFGRDTNLSSVDRTINRLENNVGRDERRVLRQRIREEGVERVAVTDSQEDRDAVMSEAYNTGDSQPSMLRRAWIDATDAVSNYYDSVRDRIADATQLSPLEQLGMSPDQINDQLSAVSTNIAKFFANISSGTIGLILGFRAFKRVIGAFSEGIQNAYHAIADIVIDMGSNIEAFYELRNIESQVTNVGLSMEYVNETANRLALSMKDIADSAGLFNSLSTALGDLEGRRVSEGLLEGLSNAGLSQDATSRSLVAVSQIAGKGVVSMEELRGQLGEAFPQALDIASRSMGMTTQQFIKLVSSGQLLATDFLPLFSDELLKSVNAVNKLERNSVILRNSLLKVKASTGETALQLADFASTKSGLSAFIGDADRLEVTIATLSATLVAFSLAGAAKFASWLFGIRAFAILAGSALDGLLVFLSSAAIPLAAVTVGIGALVVAFKAFSRARDTTQVDQMTKQFDKLADSLSKVKREAQDTRGWLDKLSDFVYADVKEASGLNAVNKNIEVAYEVYDNTPKTIKEIESIGARIKSLQSERELIQLDISIASGENADPKVIQGLRNQMNDINKLMSIENNKLSALVEVRDKLLKFKDSDAYAELSQSAKGQIENALSLIEKPVQKLEAELKKVNKKTKIVMDTSDIENAQLELDSFNEALQTEIINRDLDGVVDLSFNVKQQELDALNSYISTVQDSITSDMDRIIGELNDQTITALEKLLNKQIEKVDIQSINKALYALDRQGDDASTTYREALGVLKEQLLAQEDLNAKKLEALKLEKEIVDIQREQNNAINFRKVANITNKEGDDTRADQLNTSKGYLLGNFSKESYAVQKDLLGVSSSLRKFRTSTEVTTLENANLLNNYNDALKQAFLQLAGQEGANFESYVSSVSSDELQAIADLNVGAFENNAGLQSLLDVSKRVSDASASQADSERDFFESLANLKQSVIETEQDLKNFLQDVKREAESLRFDTLKQKIENDFQEIINGIERGLRPGDTQSIFAQLGNTVAEVIEGQKSGKLAGVELEQQMVANKQRLEDLNKEYSKIQRTLQAQRSALAEFNKIMQDIGAKRQQEAQALDTSIGAIQGHAQALIEATGMISNMEFDPSMMMQGMIPGMTSQPVAPVMYETLSDGSYNIEDTGDDVLNVVKMIEAKSSMVDLLAGNFGKVIDDMRGLWQPGEKGNYEQKAFALLTELRNQLTDSANEPTEPNYHASGSVSDQLAAQGIVNGQLTLVPGTTVEAKVTDISTGQPIHTEQQGSIDMQDLVAAQNANVAERQRSIQIENQTQMISSISRLDSVLLSFMDTRLETETKTENLDIVNPLLEKFGLFYAPEEEINAEKDIRNADQQIFTELRNTLKQLGVFTDQPFDVDLSSLDVETYVNERLAPLNNQLAMNPSLANDAQFQTTLEDVRAEAMDTATALIEYSAALQEGKLALDDSVGAIREEAARRQEVKEQMSALDFQSMIMQGELDTKSLGYVDPGQREQLETSIKLNGLENKRLKALESLRQEAGKLNMSNEELASREQQINQMYSDRVVMLKKSTEYTSKLKKGALEGLESGLTSGIEELFTGLADGILGRDDDDTAGQKEAAEDRHISHVERLAKLKQDGHISEERYQEGLKRADEIKKDNLNQINKKTDLFGNLMKGILSSMLTQVISISAAQATSGIMGGIGGGGGGGIIGSIFGGLFREGGTVGGGSGMVTTYANGGEVTEEHMLGAMVMNAMQTEGTDAVPIVAHKGEHILSDRTGDAQLYNGLKQSGRWDNMKSGIDTFNYGGQIARSAGTASHSSSSNRTNKYGRNGGMVINNTYHVKDYESFKKSEGQMSERQSRMLKRSSRRQA